MKRKENSVTPSNFFSRILKSEAFTNHIFSEQPFYGNYSKLDSQYKHCNFSRVCLLVKMASKTVTRSVRSHFEITVPNIFNVFYFFRRNYINHPKRKSKESGYGPPKFAGRKSILNLRYARTSSRFSIINNYIIKHGLKIDEVDRESGLLIFSHVVILSVTVGSFRFSFLLVSISR